jgi:hypothetical protein
MDLKDVVEALPLNLPAGKSIRIRGDCESLTL